MSKRRTTLLARYCHAHGPMMGLTNNVLATQSQTRPIAVQAEERRLERARVRQEARRKAIKKLHVGQVIKGKITNIMDYGAFVNLGNIDGLLHISEMSQSFIKDPREAIRDNQLLYVTVIRVDRPNLKVSLSLKRL